jgi:hypothetical protein
VDRYSFPVVPIQAVLDDVGIGTVVVGKWNGVLELLIIIMDRTRFYPPCYALHAIGI